MAEELTQDQLAEWSYLKEQEMTTQIKETSQHDKIVVENDINKSRIDKFKELIKEARLNLIEDKRSLWIGVGENETDLTKGFYWQLDKKSIEKDLNDFDPQTQRRWLETDKEQGIFNNREIEYNYKAEFIEKIDNLQKLFNSNQNLNEAIKTLEEKEKIDEQIKAKEAEFNEFKSPKEKRDFVSDKLNEIDGNDTLKSSLEILKEKEKIDEQIKAKEAELENKNEAKQDVANTTHSQEREAEQEDWSRKADELENQHEKELEKLRDEQSRLEANFQKSIDNLMNSGDIKDIMTALQEMDRSLEMMMRQGKEESETKERQRQEKLELAFDSPKFKDAVGDLVKEVYKQRKEVKGGLKELENEHANYAKLKTTYEKEIKKGLDVKGYEKLNKMLNEVEKETPNFKNSYPKFYKKINDSLAQSKEKILNKTKEKDQEQSRSL